MVKVCHRPWLPAGPWAWAGGQEGRQQPHGQAQAYQLSDGTAEFHSSLPAFLVKRGGFESRITRMGKFHEHCPTISNQIRAIRPFGPFVFQNLALTKPSLSPILPLPPIS
jgi:hypothetical protein